MARVTGFFVAILKIHLSLFQIHVSTSRFIFHLIIIITIAIYIFCFITLYRRTAHNEIKFLLHNFVRFIINLYKYAIITGNNSYWLMVSRSSTLKAGVLGCGSLPTLAWRTVRSTSANNTPSSTSFLIRAATTFSSAFCPRAAATNPATITVPPMYVSLALNLHCVDCRCDQYDGY